MTSSIDPWLARLAGFACALLALASMASAQQSPGAAPPPLAQAPEQASEPKGQLSDSQIRQVIDTIEDPAKRDEFVATLRGLLAAQEEATGSRQPSPADAVTVLLEEVSERTRVVNQVARSIVNSLEQVPLLWSWFESQLRSPYERELWLTVGTRVGLILGIGILAHLALAALVRVPLRRLAAEPPANLPTRVRRSLGILLLRLIPLLGFVLASYTALAAGEAHPTTRSVVVPLINAVAIVRTAIALARFALAPKTSALRILPLDDAAAAYGMRWFRRILSTGVYGYFSLEAARAIGLPWTLHGFLLHVLFVAVALMIIVVIIRCRGRGAAAIASLGAPDRPASLRRLPWTGLARAWHVLAIVYVLLVYLVWALKIPGGFETLLKASVGSALVVLAGWVVFQLLQQLVRKVEVEVRGETEPSAPDVQRRAGRYLPLLGFIARGGVFVLCALLLLQVWGVDAVGWLSDEAGQKFTGHLVTVAVIALVTLVVWEALSLLIERSITEEDEEGNLRLSNRTRTLLNIMRNFLLVFLSMIALFLILSELGLNIAPLLAGAGVIGLAIGFGAQKLVQDIITGMFVLLGDTMRVGDVVEVAGRSGVVEQMTLRTVALRDLSGCVHTIPYSSIDTVMNYTQDFSYALIDLGVAYRENVDEVMEVLRQLGAEMNRDPEYRRQILEPLEILGVDAFADSAVVIRLRFKTRPLKQWGVGREFRRRIKNRFDELGIEIPFPHQTLYFGADKQGRAQPAAVKLQTEAAAETAPSDRSSEAEVLAEQQARLAQGG